MKKKILLSGGKKKARKKEYGAEEANPCERRVRVVKKEEAGIRLNRYIAGAGVCSRREADKLIAGGEITVNGEVNTGLGTKVGSDDQVCYKGKLLCAEQKMYLLLNKPRGYVTTVDDPHAVHTVMELVEHACAERVYPVGRLDKETTGLLLLTNDGELAKKLTHPSYERKKIYHVFLNRKFSEEHLEQLRQGIELEDGPVAADAVNFADAADRKQVGMEIHSGRNRIVRRIFEHMGYRVVRLDRVSFAGLTKKNLPRGKWRFLSAQEVAFLKMS
ncbi:MAG: pseudouridine synthase [Mangrovibacterium sp.]